jgi:predicted aspartyl protease
VLSCVVPARVNNLGIALLAVHCAGTSIMRAAELKTNQPSAVVQVPLEIRRGAAFVKVRVNDSEPLAFKLDTGFGVTTIHPELVETLGLKPAGTITINGIAGEEESDWLSGATFDFAGMKYSPRRVVSIPSDARRPRRQRDGILGSGFFRRFVVELDPVGKTMTLHEPARFDYTGKGEIIPLQFRRDTPTVEATIHIPDREPLRARYEIDSGCDGALCLGHDFVKTNKLDEAVAHKRASSRTGVGGSVDTHETRLPQFQLGTRKLDEVQANFFREGSPVDDDLAGHIGMGVLREFKVIFDYSRRRMILESLK